MKTAKDLAEENKKLFSIMIVGSAIFIGLLFIFGIYLMLQPAALCSQWGGKLYQDNKCYLIDDMTKCLAPSGLMDRSRSIIFNLTEDFNNG